MKTRIAVMEGLRTPFCKSGTTLRRWQADDLGAFVVRELLARYNLPIDEVIFGNVAQPIEAANVARIIALKAGLPDSTIAHTVQRNCASGMQSITTAFNQILLGRSNVVIAGGTESMSNIPLLFNSRFSSFFEQLYRSKTFVKKLTTLLSFRPSYLKPIIGLEVGLTDPIHNMIMGLTAEKLAREFGISRLEQDTFALGSHQRAIASQESKIGRAHV